MGAHVLVVGTTTWRKHTHVGVFSTLAHVFERMHGIYLAYASIL